MVKSIPILILIALFFSCKNKSRDCYFLKKGRSHAYKEQKHIIIIRTDTLDIEIKAATNDTSYWKIRWLSPCSFSGQYLSGIHMESKKQEEFYKNTVIVYSIEKIEADFYITKGEGKTLMGDFKTIDTTWFKEK